MLLSILKYKLIKFIHSIDTSLTPKLGLNLLTLFIFSLIKIFSRVDKIFFGVIFLLNLFFFEFGSIVILKI